jgi:hypothetical protein
MTFEQFSNGLLEWLIRGAGLLWLVGAFMLARQIFTEWLIDGMAPIVEQAGRQLRADLASLDPNFRPEEPVRDEPEEAWILRDNAARRGWIAAQAVVLAASALAMMLLHPFAPGMVALLVLGQGVYFFWREYTARRAPTPKAAAHARPSASTVNAGWVSFAVALLVWFAAFRGLLN